MKTNRQNLPYYLLAIGIFLLLRFGFVHADTDDLAFLLKPTAKLVGLLTGSPVVCIFVSRK